MSISKRRIIIYGVKISNEMNKKKEKKNIKQKQMHEIFFNTKISESLEQPKSNMVTQGMC